MLTFIDVFFNVFVMILFVQHMGLLNKIYCYLLVSLFCFIVFIFICREMVIGVLMVA